MVWKTFEQEFADFDYLHGYEFGTTISFALCNALRMCMLAVMFSACCPSLKCSIGHIISICSKKKMRWIYASWIIAAMTNA